MVERLHGKGHVPSLLSPMELVMSALRRAPTIASKSAARGTSAECARTAPSAASIGTTVQNMVSSPSAQSTISVNTDRKS